MKNIIFFGAGNISQAIIIGLIKSGMSKDNILYIDRNAKNKKVLLRMGIKPINIKNIA